VPFAALAAVALSLAAAAPATASAATSRPHVVTIVMENREASAVLGSPDAPYINRLARRYAVAEASYGVAHPSLPNYLALTSGSTHGIASDCTDCQVRARNIVDQLEHAHVSWKAYMEGLPRPCFKGAGSGVYAKKHDPFIYYADVAGNARRCGKVVALTRLTADLRAGALPRYAFIAPGLCNDGHDCDTATADRFLSGLVPKLLPALGPRGFLVVTWDEGTTGQDCCGGAAGGRIATIVAGPRARRGARMHTPVDHYGVLRTVEDALGLPHLGGAADPRSGSLRPLLRR
jgi:phosphatidylinositol-3-phosphatase